MNILNAFNSHRNSVNNLNNIVPCENLNFQINGKYGKIDRKSITRSSNEEISKNISKNDELINNMFNTPLKMKLQTERNFNFISTNTGSNGNLIGNNTDPKENRYLIKENLGLISPGSNIENIANNFLPISEHEFFTLHKVANSLEKIPFINNNTYYNNFNIVNNFQTITEKDAKDLLMKKQSFKKYGTSTNFEGIKKSIEFNTEPSQPYQNNQNNQNITKESSQTQYKFYPSNTSARNFKGVLKKNIEKENISKRINTSRQTGRTNHYMVTSASVESLGGSNGYQLGPFCEREKIERVISNKKVLSSNSKTIEKIIDGFRRPFKGDDDIVKYIFNFKKIIEDIEDYDEVVLKTDNNPAPKRIVKNSNLFGSVELPSSSRNMQFNKIINGSNQFKKVTLNNLRDQLKTYSKDKGVSNILKSKTTKIPIMSPNPIEKKFSSQQIKEKLISSTPKDSKQSNYKINSIYNTTGSIKSTNKLMLKKQY